MLYTCWIGIVLSFFTSLQAGSSLTWQVGEGDRGCSLSRNPILQYLRDHGVGMLQQPIQTDSHCKAEWGKFGTCCDPGQALSFINGLDRQVKSSLGTLTSSLNSSLEKMKALIKTTKIVMLIEEFTQLSGSVSAQEKECSDSIRRIVGATVCAACSSRGNHFFGDSKVHITDDDCRTTIHHCGD